MTILGNNDGFDKWRNPKLKLRTKNKQLGMKYAKRRALLKKGKSPIVQFSRLWSKASTLGKIGIASMALAPKAILIGAGYFGAKSASKKENKKQPKKYMAG